MKGRYDDLHGDEDYLQACFEEIQEEIWHEKERNEDYYNGTIRQAGKG